MTHMLVLSWAVSFLAITRMLVLLFEAFFHASPCSCPYLPAAPRMPEF